MCQKNVKIIYARTEKNLTLTVGVIELDFQKLYTLPVKFIGLWLLQLSKYRVSQKKFLCLTGCTLKMTVSTQSVFIFSEYPYFDLGTVHMNLKQLIAPGQLTDPGVNFASVHACTVHMSFSLSRRSFERRITRCTTQAARLAEITFLHVTERKSCPRTRVVLRMLIINVQNKFSNKKFQKATEIRERVQHSFSVAICVKTKGIQINW